MFLRVTTKTKRLDILYVVRAAICYRDYVVFHQLYFRFWLLTAWTNPEVLFTSRTIFHTNIDTVDNHSENTWLLENIYPPPSIQPLTSPLLLETLCRSLSPSP